MLTPKDASTLETFRRMAYGACEYCGADYTEHRMDAQSACDPTRCEAENHCHQSDFKCASDDPTLLGRDELFLIWTLLPVKIRRQAK